MIKYLLYSLTLITFFPSVVADTQCPVVPSLGADRRVDKNVFRLVQYNVEWLFIDEYNGCPGSSCTWTNQSQASTHLDYVTKVINDIDADYINFCEIEGCDELNMLISKTNLDYKPYLIQGTDSSTGQNVGVLTKIDPKTNLIRTEDRYEYPLPGSNCGYTGSSGTTGVSKHYITTMNINEMNIAIFGSHLLAYPTDSSRCASREAQAQVLQPYIFDYINKGYEVIVIGDLNDYDNKVPDINNHMPISKVLDILKGFEGDYKNLYELQPVSTFVNQADRYTEWYDENKNCKQDKSDLSMIDHILVSKKIYEKISNVFMYHDYQQSCGTYNSDHWPIVVDFTF